MRLARLFIAISVVLVVISLAAGCSDDGSSGEPERSTTDAEASVTATEAVTPGASLAGSWVHVEGGTKTVLQLTPAGEGSIAAYAANPGVPGATAAFPLKYEVTGDTVVLTFNNGSTTSFEIVHTSDGEFEARALEPGTWTVDGVWARAN